MSSNPPEATSPSPSPSPADHARALMARKDEIESELQEQIDILKSNNVTMDTPLVDAEGFPRADIDLWVVRTARKRVIELRNDLRALMDEIAGALEKVYDPSVPSPSLRNGVASSSAVPTKPFARVEAVAPGSPSAEAALQRGDLVLKFGGLDHNSFQSSSLQPIAELVAASENRAIRILVSRDNVTKALTLTPRKNWGGRGTLGCHIVPYTAS
ncbi:26S proteasome non-ATPase regulatory subunit 9 [Psilocybe cubensis]|uniref:26S proteasome non-ATPase regulatory subunit 9 n=2 Tax=Psilocybe cubensis TaxID=181762 RepID=A0ACB8GUB9_PSICU|nr:26S proteasome non-ATPase regulatory subunit 9 [Psilocybe cubensis]KAH9479228.1 26S proteasome non-ATPase regulatory subunit 9 [Psilocybe cubensis]